MRISLRTKEYLTAGRTLDELRQQEAAMHAAGFRKRRNSHGQSPVTGEFYQWWDRKGTTSLKARQQSGRCRTCGEKTVISTRGRRSQWCRIHLERYREYAKKYYHEKLKPLRQNRASL